MPFINPEFPGRIFHNYQELKEAKERLDQIGKTREELLSKDQIPIPNKEDIDSVKIGTPIENVKNAIHIVAELKTTSEYMRSLMNVVRGNTNMLSLLLEKVNATFEKVNILCNKICDGQFDYREKEDEISQSQQEQKRDQDFQDNVLRNRDGIPIGIDLFAYTTKKKTLATPELVKCTVTPEGYKVGEKVVKSLSRAAQIASGNIRNGFNWWRISPDGPTVRDFYKVRVK